MAERILGSVDISIHNDLEFETVTVTVNGRFKQDGQRRTDSIALTGDEVETVMPGLMSKLREHMAAGGAHTVSDIPKYVPPPEPELEAGD